jgi:DNA-binding SARP family transcriptional activator
LRLQLLGRVRAWRGTTELGLGGPQQRALLGLLALAAGQPVTRFQIVSTLWPDQPPRTAINVIQTRVKSLRRAVAAGPPGPGAHAYVTSVGDGYALNLDPEATDVGRFRRLVADSRSRWSADRRRAAALLAEALRLWDGAPCADVPMLAEHPKVVALLAERRLALGRYGEAMISIGAADEALPALEEAVAAQPLDEATQVVLVRTYQAAGQPGRAVALYHEVRRRLADELGLDPSSELAEAYQAVLRATPPEVRGEAAPVPSQLPADVYAFTGRADELSFLDGLVERPEPGPATAPVIAAVSGSAGVGKTALAVHWAHRVRRHFPDGQLHLDLRGHHADDPVAPGDALARLLGALGVAGDQIPLDLDDRAARYRTELAGRRMVVLLDNAGSAEQVRPLLPGTPSCLVLITSRDRLPALVALHGARRLDVDVLPAAEAVSLLRTLIGARVDGEPDATLELAQRCARLPLALRIAAELANSRPPARLAELVAELGDQRARLAVLDVGDDPRGAVRTVFSWSYHRLPPDVATVFRMLGLHPGPDADPYAIAALCGTELDAARDLVAQLVRAHLAQPTTDQRVRMHELLAQYAAERARAEDGEQVRDAALTRLADYYLATCAEAMGVLYPAERVNRPLSTTARPPATTRRPTIVDTTMARAWLAAEMPVLVALCATGPARHTIRLAQTLYRYLEQGHYVEALHIQTHALAAATRAGDLAGRAGALTSLGAVQRLLGDYATATEHLTRAIEAYGECSDADGEARALSNLGVIEERTGRYDAAIEHHRAALARYRSTGNRLGQAGTLNNLAAAYAKGQAEQAVEAYHEALALYRELGDPAGAATALANLGNASAALGRFDVALDCQEQALALFRRLGHGYAEAAVLNNLGDLDTQLGHHRSAAERQQEALAIFRRLGHRYGEVTALNGLGEALLGLDQPAAAVEQHVAAASLAVDTGDRDEQARAHRGAGHAHRRLGHPARAREELRRAMVLYRELNLPQADQVLADIEADQVQDQRQPPHG